jgi:hypothetical protein
MKLDLIRNLGPGFIIGLLLLLTWPMAALAGSPGDGDSKLAADGLKVELNFAVEPVKTGSNEVVVKLSDAAGQPIDGAEVMVVAAELLQVDPDHHDNIGAGTDTHQPAPATGHDMAGMDDHQPEAATGHDMAGMDNHQPEAATGHDMAEADADDHQPEAATGHDMAEADVDDHQPEAGHSGGHGEPAPAKLIAGLTPGEYQGQVSFIDEGRWRVKVNFSAQGQAKKEAEFTVEVLKRGPNWYVLGGFLSVNMGVVASAAVMKQQAAKARTE